MTLDPGHKITLTLNTHITHLTHKGVSVSINYRPCRKIGHGQTKVMVDDIDRYYIPNFVEIGDV